MTGGLRSRNIPVSAPAHCRAGTAKGRRYASRRECLIAKDRLSRPVKASPSQSVAKRQKPAI